MNIWIMLCTFRGHVPDTDAIEDILDGQATTCKRCGADIRRFRAKSLPTGYGRWHWYEKQDFS